MLTKHSKRKQNANDTPYASDGIQATALQDQDADGQDTLDIESVLPDLKKIKRGKRRKRIILFAVILVVAVVGIYAFKQMKPGQTMGGMTYNTYDVQKRNIVVSLSGSGNLKPADSYVVSSLLDGEILSAPFEEGDIVKKDSVLYQFDSSAVASSMEQAENSLAESQRTYDSSLKAKGDLNIKANGAGKIVDLKIKAGDTVTAGQTIAQIRDSEVMRLKLPFDASDAKTFHVGQSAAVTFDGSFETTDGTVSEISSVDEVLTGNKIVREVSIDVKNPGGISTAQAATAVIGGAACSGSGTFANKDEATVTATVSGTVSSLKAAKGDTVSDGQVIAVLKSDAVDNSIFGAGVSVKNAEIALKNQSKKMEDYTIKSPIAGTIIDKGYKQGDTHESGKTLCTIFDLSYLTLTLNIDELDIGKVEIGQKVEITSAALPGKTFDGVVTKININGATSNGITSYPVTIRIEKPGELLPGMNVTGKIVVESLENVLSVPVSAVSRNNRVLIRTDAAAAAAKTGTATDGKADVSAAPAGTKAGAAPGAPGVPGAPAGAPTIPADPATGLPAGFEYKDVTLGGSDKDYIAIIDGVKEGDVVAVLNTAGMMGPFGPGSGAVTESGE